MRAIAARLAKIRVLTGTAPEQIAGTNALDLGLCAIPIEDPAFETVPLFKDELVAILPAKIEHVLKSVRDSSLPS